MAQTPSDREHRKRLRAILQSIQSTCTPPKLREAGMAGRAAYYHLVHLRDLFDGVVLLLEKGQAHGAFTLGRSMFETSLMLGAMEDSSTRDAVALRWYHDGGSDFRRMAKAAKRAGVTDAEGWGPIITSNDQKLAAARKAFGVQSLPSRLNPENTARQQGRGEDIPNYILAHAFTHGGYGALHDADELRSTYHLNQAHNVELLEVATNFTGRSALLGYRSGYRILELDEPSPLAGLLDDVEFPDVTSTTIVRIE